MSGAARMLSIASEEERSVSHEFDVVCLGGGVAAEAIAVGLRDSGLMLAIVERELVGGECPYSGWVPSKTSLRASESLAEAATFTDPEVAPVGLSEAAANLPRASRRSVSSAGTIYLRGRSR